MKIRINLKYLEAGIHSDRILRRHEIKSEFLLPKDVRYEIKASSQTIAFMSSRLDFINSIDFAFHALRTTPTKLRRH